MNLIKLVKNKTARKVLIFFITFLFIYGIMLTSLVDKRYDLKEGDIAKVDIKAPREVLDRIATEERKKQAENSVPQQYDLKSDVETSAEDEVNNYFDKINAIRGQNIDAKQKAATIKTTVTYNLSDNELDILANMNKDDYNSLQANIIKTLKGMFTKGIREGNTDDVKAAGDYIIAQFNNSKLSNDLKNIGILITNSYIKTNLLLDNSKTQELKDEAQKKVTSVLIKKDQIVVKEGEPVTKEQLQILEDLGLLNSNTNYNWYIYVNLAVLDLVIILLEAFYLFKQQKDLFKDDSKIILICLLNIISLIFARTISIISPFLIPLACIPMILTLLIDNKVALSISILNCVLISGVVQFNIQITLISIMSALLVAIILKKVQMRNDILYDSLYISIVNTILTFCVGFLLSNNIVDIFKISGFTFIGGCLSAIFTIGLLPILESAFDIVTTVKLLELSNPNQPLLKKLSMEAPGTYHHSILVANLAEVAAEAVGGNPVVSRVAAYYHDVGKIKRPYFFKENQIGKENPHNKITPNLSSLVITSHVKDGLELAREYKLPKMIQDVIAEHHGTTLVKYFYITMKNASENPEEVKEENFKYPGPIPSSKESAIIMLSDSVEASVRTIQDPTKGKIEEMVNNIVKAKLDEGQLSNSDLTLRDIDKIKQSFCKTLIGVYHHRIEYPEDKSQLKK